MRKAIKKVFSGTNHRLCVWHLHQNAIKHLNHVYKTQVFNRCIYDLEEEEESIKAWEYMLDKYDLRDDSWLKATYNEKNGLWFVEKAYVLCGYENYTNK